MVDLKDYLNIKNSTRNLLEEDFLEIVPELAKQLAEINFESKYTNEQLYKDWKTLCKWKSQENYINSTSRIGMKLCDNFFPNFFDIQNKSGMCFRDYWTSKNLEKILIWNRKSHETPYLSELKRGIYFCLGLTKNTMYRPQIAKMICTKYSPKIVLDPCAGWGGRMLGVVSTGAKYIGFEPNIETYNNLLKLSNFLHIEDKVILINEPAQNILKYRLNKVDMILTSPPYYDVEIYSNTDKFFIKKYPTYDLWSKFFLKDIIDKSLTLLNNGVSCWNVGKVGKKDMNDDVLKYHEEKGYFKYDVFAVVSSKRQALQKNGNDKNSDQTIVYRHNSIKE